MFALVSAGLVSAYTIPTLSALCNNSETETTSAFETLLGDPTYITGLEPTGNVVGCRLSGFELDGCAVFQWMTGNQHVVELQCTGGQSCALARYEDATAWKDIILSPQSNQLQSIILSDNSKMLYTTGDQASANEHDGVGGYTCSNTCAVRSKVAPHSTGQIYVTAKVGQVATSNGATSFKVLNQQFVILSGAVMEATWGILLLVMALY